MNTRAIPASYAGLLVVGAVVMLFWPTFASMVAIWNRDDTFTHGYIIPLLSLWLLWRDRAQLSAQPILPEFRVLWLVALAALGWLAADVVEVQVVSQIAATALIPLALWAALGTKWARRALFPLCYLFFAVPFGDFMVPILVRFTTETTVAAVQLVGVPIYREGAAFMLPSGNFEVVKACSGVRYLIATIALGVLFAALTYDTWRRRIAFMALCLVIPIVANSIRAFGIVMIAHYSDMQYAVGFDHLIYGWAFFGLVILLLFWIGGKFADAKEPIDPGLHAHQAPIGASALALVLGVLAVMPAAAHLIHYQLSALSAAQPPLTLVSPTGEWQAPEPNAQSDKQWRPAFMSESDVGVGNAAEGRYASKGREVRAFVRRYDLQAEGTSEATAAMLVPEGNEWRLEAESSKQLGDHVVAIAEVIGRNGERWRTWRWYLINDLEARGAVDAKWLQLKSWMKGSPPRAAVASVAVYMPDARVETGLAADAVLERFVTDYAWRLWSSP